MRRGRPTIFALILCSILILGSVALGLVYLFRPTVHRELPSPNGDFCARIIKRHSFRPDPVVIEVLVVHDGESSNVVQVTGNDMWADVDDRAYPIRWLSPSEFLIGSRWGTFDDAWRVRVDWPELGVSFPKTPSAGGTGS